MLRQKETELEGEDVSMSRRTRHTAAVAGVSLVRRRFSGCVQSKPGAQDRVFHGVSIIYNIWLRPET